MEINMENLSYQLKINTNDPLNQTALIGFANTLKWKKDLTKKEIFYIVSRHDSHKTIP